MGGDTGTASTRGQHVGAIGPPLPCDVSKLRVLGGCTPVTVSDPGVQNGPFVPPVNNNEGETTREHYLLTCEVSSWLARVKFTLVSLSHCQIKAEDDQPLPGVLLSLSGGMFRSNLLTQDNGILTFSNLVRCPVTELLPAFPTREQGRGVCDGRAACLTA